MIRYYEHHLEQRIEAAKKLADKIRNATNIDTEEDAEQVLRYVLSRHYKIPYFSEYFDKLTLDQLFFEVELITMDKPQKQATPEDASKVVKDNKKEADAIIDEFDAWIKQDMNQETPESDIKEDPFFKVAQEFMKTGNFVEEKQSKENEDVGE